MINEASADHATSREKTERNTVRGEPGWPVTQTLERIKRCAGGAETKGRSRSGIVPRGSSRADSFSIFQPAEERSRPVSPGLKILNPGDPRGTGASPGAARRERCSAAGAAAINRKKNPPELSVRFSVHAVASMAIEAARRTV